MPLLKIDEADNILLDNAMFLSHEKIVALSATAFTDEFINERQYVESLKFLCLNSSIEGDITDPLNATEEMSLEKFLRSNANYAKMIYNSDSDFDSTSELGATFMKDCDDLPRLKELTKNDVLLITKANLTRGVDYRVKEPCLGIALLVMS